jgi:hypothetical protein
MFSPQIKKSPLEIYRVIYGQTLTPMNVTGIKKVFTKPTTLLKSYYDNYLTLTTFPDGFGVVQGLMTNDKKLVINFYKSSTFLGDAIQGQFVILSPSNFKINIEGTDVFISSIIGFN